MLLGSFRVEKNDTNKVIPNPYKQNGEFLNINFEDDNLERMEVPKELLYKVYIMRCASNFEVDCTAPGGMATDFNYWDRSLSDKEVKDWTTCKQVNVVQ